MSLLVGCAVGGCIRSRGDLFTAACGDPATHAPGPCPEWPNVESNANSDAWLMAHHDEIELMRPRVLVLHFYRYVLADELRPTLDRHISALREGSRYHAYADPSAPPFLAYEVAKIVDLVDPAPPGWLPPSSTLLPTIPTASAEGVFDAKQLFAQPYTDLIDIADPEDPGVRLDLCQLFERGIIHEVWLNVGDEPPRGPPPVLERRRVYDGAGKPMYAEGKPLFESAPALEGVTCNVSIRMVSLRPERGAGCDLRDHGAAFESLTKTIPYLDANARPFLNRDMKDRFHTCSGGVCFDGWSDICPPDYTWCVKYAGPTRATDPRNFWSIDPFWQGCGGVDFPPNARWRWDFHNDDPTMQHIMQRCAHYGMRDDPNGNDAYELYPPEVIDDYDKRFEPDCGGGWQIYWRQSLPGLRNSAFDASGKQMRNWWPYLFY